MDDKAIVIFKINQNEIGIDIEIPLNITANELIFGLNKGFNLGINMDDPTQCYLRMENPIGFLRGDTMLNEYGIRNGSVIYVE
ncbi:hypothetical protein D6853_15035 [Butyrivibrio sp. X503]|uniref:EsaB/YukD family protein n=1 Tax=Butyrivibrio sp. X503 TaxID=2364878 RepID=UPI000EA89AE3|nr:EsaB/YukD family protein [Butyrivibrio sp. X503]RKM53850.1 hypothetical protein D6853_15035 [Butyrivibrio sp. X503]